jgi:hypothetical protein
MAVVVVALLQSAPLLGAGVGALGQAAGAQVLEPCCSRGAWRRGVPGRRGGGESTACGCQPAQQHLQVAQS